MTAPPRTGPAHRAAAEADPFHHPAQEFPMPRLVLDRADFRDRVHACWLGKSIGGTLGAPHEGKRCALDLAFYDPVPVTAAANDDLDLQLVWLAAMEEAGTIDPSFTQLCSAWTRWANAYPWNEYGFFMRNHGRGLRPPVAGCFENYFVDEMGSPIRSEIWAILHAGDPQAAARMAWKDSALDHAGGEGTWGEMFWSAVQAAAFVEHDAQTLIRIGLHMIPLASHLGRCIREAVWCHGNGIGYEQARTRITNRFAGLQPFNAVPNHGFTILGWLYGEDFGDKLLKAVNCGWDTDCTGATLGATLGIIAGTAGIPARWLAPVGEAIVLHPYTRVPGAPATIGELTRRTVALAERAVTAERGFGDRTSLPPDLRSRLLRNDLARACQARDVHCGIEDVAGHEVALHYGGEPVLRCGEDKEVAVTVDGVAAEAALSVPPAWRCDALGAGRFRLRCDAAIPGRNRIGVVLPGLPPVAFTILGPDEARGFGAGYSVDKCPECQGRLESCICSPEQIAVRDRTRTIGGWQVAGPFPGAVPGTVSLDDAMPWEDELVAGGRPDLRWLRAQVVGGVVDLNATCGARDWVYAYAVTEFDRAAGGPAELVCGSDDGIRLWLNGVLVHSREVQRGCRMNDDHLHVTLKPGPNRLVAKVDNYSAGWAMAVGIIDPR
jgi:ADP-ribosylglycohydrolase